MSLRNRLLAGVALVAVVLAVASMVATRIVEGYLLNQVDASLQDSRLAGSLSMDHTPFGPGADQEQRLSSVYVGLVASDGTVLTRLTPNIATDAPPLPQISAEAVRASASTGTPFTVASTDPDVTYRALGRPVGRGGRLLVVARPLNELQAAMAHLTSVQWIATGLVLLVLVLVTGWVLGHGIRPVRRMTTAAKTIARGDLSHRVPHGGTGTEADELGAALNQMLGRIEDAFAQRTQSENRLRQFVADASHELRTPVATIRGYAELYRSGGLDDRCELAEAMRRTEQEALRMGRLVDDLLQLARLDQGSPLALRPVDLSLMARDAARDAGAIEPGRPITTNAEEVRVLADEHRLHQVFANLIGNALVHTPAETPVAVEVRADDGAAVVEVRDQGPGMDPESAQRAFERFYRADRARSRQRGGSGLGLAIVKATVEAHGGTVTLDSAPDSGTTVRVTLPQRATASGSASGPSRLTAGSELPRRT